MLGNEEDFTAALGFEVEGLDENLSALDPANFRKMIERAIAEFPNFKAVATTLRHAKTASLNDWAAVCCTDGTLHSSRAYHETSRSGTASAAATPSPRASSTASSPARGRSGRSSAAPRTAPSR